MLTRCHTVYHHHALCIIERADLLMDSGAETPALLVTVFAAWFTIILTSCCRESTGVINNLTDGSTPFKLVRAESR